MHFRIRKNVVQLVRTNYDPQTKKPKTSIIGKMLLADPVLTEELKNLLSDQEIAETRLWIEHNNRINLLREELAALTLPDTLSLANRWFKHQGKSQAAIIAAEYLLPELQSLRKTLKSINSVS